MNLGTLTLDDILTPDGHGGMYVDNLTDMYQEIMEKMLQERKRIAEFRAQNPEYVDAPEEWIKELI